MSITVNSPEPGFSGEVAGVVFANGEATLAAEAGYSAALAYFRRRGYRITDAEPEPADEPAAPAAGPDEGDLPFDPSQHNVDEVIDYLDSVADDEEETLRVLLAEAEGKNRKTITERSSS